MANNSDLSALNALRVLIGAGLEKDAQRALHELVERNNLEAKQISEAVIKYGNN